MKDVRCWLVGPVHMALQPGPHHWCLQAAAREPGNLKTAVRRRPQPQL